MDTRAGQRCGQVVEKLVQVLGADLSIPLVSLIRKRRRLTTGRPTEEDGRAAKPKVVRDLCSARGVGVIVYYSLASGFLSGKYRSKADLKGARSGGVEKYLNQRGLRILGALDAVARAHGAKPAEVALAWLIAREGVTAPIASATNADQVDSLVRATQLELSPQEIASLTAASD